MTNPQTQSTCAESCGSRTDACQSRDDIQHNKPTRAVQSREMHAMDMQLLGRSLRRPQRHSPRMRRGGGKDRGALLEEHWCNQKKILSTMCRCQTPRCLESHLRHHLVSTLAQICLLTSWSKERYRP